MSDGRRHVPHVFKGTGVSVALRHVSSIKTSEAIRSIKKPVPPLNTIPNGNGTSRQEPNPDDPDYLNELQMYYQTLEGAVRLVYIKWGVEYELSASDKAKVDQWRAEFKQSTGSDLIGDDKTVFITFFALDSNDDYKEFIEAIKGGSEATDPKLESGATSTT